MPRPGRRRQVERNRWRQFRTVGESFAQAAEMATQFQVSYSGAIYRQEDIRRMAKHLSRYRSWTDRLLTD